MKFFGPHRPERVLLRRNTLYTAQAGGVPPPPPRSERGKMVLLTDRSSWNE